MSRTTVLVVDDDASLRDVLARFLGDEGYAVHAAASGREALVTLDGTRPDIMLLDLAMPDVDGYGVLDALRQRGQVDLPTLVFSGYRPDAALLAALDGPHRDFIAKPFDLDELHIRLQRLLRHDRRLTPAVPAPRDALRIQALGGLRVHRGEILLVDERWRNKLAKSLFKLLLTAHGQRMSKEALIEELWPEADPDTALNRLRVTVYDLRRKLGDGDRSGGAPHLITQQEGAYVFDPAGACWTDARAFAEALRQGHDLARQDRPEEALGAYQQAETLYAGDYLRDDPFAAWSLAPRARLREAYLDLLATIGRLQARRGDLDTAIYRCRQILRLEPWREETYRQLMGYLAAAERRGEALRVFEECRRALAAEGVEPARTTRRLYERLAAGEDDGLSHPT